MTQSHPTGGRHKLFLHRCGDELATIRVALPRDGATDEDYANDARRLARLLADVLPVQTFEALAKEMQA